MSRLGFYGWMRESVKRAVLQGVSDAVEQLGTPPDQEELHPQLAKMLQPSRQAALAELPAARGSSSAPAAGRRRLGRSLSEVQRDEQTPADE